MTEPLPPDLLAATKAKDAARLKTLRGVQAALGESAVARPAAPRRTLSAEEIREVIDAERAELDAAAAALRASGRDDEAAHLEARRRRFDTYA